MCQYLVVFEKLLWRNRSVFRFEMYCCNILQLSEICTINISISSPYSRKSLNLASVIITFSVESRYIYAGKPAGNCLHAIRAVLKLKSYFCCRCL